MQLVIALAVLGLSPAVALGSTPASPTITGAQQLNIGDTESGGGHHIDFWLVTLAGGDQLQLNVTGSAGFFQAFQLYAPGTTDASFTLTPAVDSVMTNGTSPDLITLQAPYSGTFVLASCQNVNQAGDCRGVDTGEGTNPMIPYTFTTALVGGGVPPATAAAETQAGSRIAAAKPLQVGAFEAGGGGHIDFWLVTLAGGDQLQLNVTGSAGFFQAFQLYAPGTTDASFTLTPAVDSVMTNGTSPDLITLQAPYSGTFVLASCQNVNQAGDCRGVDTGEGTNPMIPYTFTTTLVADPTSTSVACTPTSVATGSATSCTATVTDTASSGASTPTGTVSSTSSPTTGAFGSSGSCPLQASGTAGAASCSVTFTPSAAGGYTITGSYNGDGGHQTSQGAGPLSATTATPSGQPSLIGPPSLSGVTRAGRTLTCSTGTWTGNPTGYTYTWHRNGTLLAGFTGPTYKLGTLDQGTTLTCVVTAKNAAGQASAASNAVRIPIPKVPQCPGATGSMTGTTIGQITLGMTRSRARHLYRRHSNRSKQFEDFFCLTPIGVRVGYASPILLNSVAKHAQFAVRGRVMWASTSNPYYALDGVRAGESILTAARVLGTEPPFHIGLNYWYLARKGSYTAVLKVRGTVVQELGIADNALTKTRKAQNVLMHSFY